MRRPDGRPEADVSCEFVVHLQLSELCARPGGKAHVLPSVCRSALPHGVCWTTLVTRESFQQHHVARPARQRAAAALWRAQRREPCAAGESACRASSSPPLTCWLALRESKTHRLAAAASPPRRLLCLPHLLLPVHQGRLRRGAASAGGCQGSCPPGGAQKQPATVGGPPGPAPGRTVCRAAHAVAACRCTTATCGCCSQRCSLAYTA